MSYLQSFPRSHRGARRTFWSISRLWYTDKFHPETCHCDGCFLGPKGQLEFSYGTR
jgi:hypothetical protein